MINSSLLSSRVQEALPFVGVVLLLCGCEVRYESDAPSAKAAYAECLAQLERVRHHPDEQFYWNSDGRARVIKAWCEDDPDYSLERKQGVVNGVFQFTHPTKYLGMEDVAPGGVVTIYPKVTWFTYPMGN